MAALTFEPAMRLGAAYAVLDNLVVSSDVHYRFGDWLGIAGGTAYLTDDFQAHLFQFGAGPAFSLGPVDIALGAAVRTDGHRLAQLGVSLKVPRRR